MWAPQPGPQKALIDCPIPEVFYGGARGGGKTDGVLGKLALKAARYGEGFNGLFCRRELPMLDDAIERSSQIFGALGARWLDQKKTWRFPGGGRLRFRPLETISDAEKYQGQNVSDAAIEEAGQYPDSAPIDRLNGVLRSAAGVPTQLMLTGNPGGAGHHWLKARYVDPAPGGMHILTRTLPNGAPHRYVFIPSRLQNNRALLHNDPGYVNRLYLVGSPELVRAWLDGDWGVVAGAYFPEFQLGRHVLKACTLPSTHFSKRFRAVDWGSAKPFCVQWWANCDETWQGEGVVGNALTVPRGSLVCYREWYGVKVNVDGTPMFNEGVKMPVEQWAAGVLSRDGDGEDVAWTIADPAMWISDGGPSLAERAEEVKTKGKKLEMRKATNKREPGWDQVRARLQGDDGQPLIYLMDNQPHTIRTIQSVQHDEKRPEDLDTEAEDHAVDCTRYACMSRPRPLRKPDPRQKTSGPKPWTGDWLMQGKYDFVTPAQVSRYKVE